MCSDRLDLCASKRHWLTYPNDIEYRFNSRGFRDTEWPDSAQELSRALYCFGDSEAVGIGRALCHTLSGEIQSQSHHRCLNISALGTSNAWQARQARYVLERMPQARVIMHWTFLWRRELAIDSAEVQSKLQQEWREFYQAIRDSSWPPCDHYQEFDSLPTQIREEIKKEFRYDHTSFDISDDYTISVAPMRGDLARQSRRDHWDEHSEQQDLDDFAQALDLLRPWQHRVIHTWIPLAAEDAVMARVYQLCEGMVYVPMQPVLDLARDGFHYGRETAAAIARKVVMLL